MVDSEFWEAISISSSMIDSLVQLDIINRPEHPWAGRRGTHGRPVELKVKSGTHG